MAGVTRKSRLRKLRAIAAAMRKENFALIEKRKRSHKAWKERKRRNQTFNHGCPIANAFADVERALEDALSIVSRAMTEVTDRKERCRRVIDHLCGMIDRLREALGAERILPSHSRKQERS